MTWWRTSTLKNPWIYVIASRTPVTNTIRGSEALDELSSMPNLQDFRPEVLDPHSNHVSDGPYAIVLERAFSSTGTIHILDIGNWMVTRNSITHIIVSFIGNPDVLNHFLGTLIDHSNAEVKVNTFYLGSTSCISKLQISPA
ncbi:hypothetical protein BGX31_000435 [Mortierella sp. GBA43]|nr:hypothetical protein BGX31_000435 [Mortierella sp. GBA43]